MSRASTAEQTLPAILQPKYSQIGRLRFLDQNATESICRAAVRPGFGEQAMHHVRANHRQEFCSERVWTGSVKIKSKNKQK